MPHTWSIGSDGSFLPKFKSLIYQLEAFLYTGHQYTSSLTNEQRSIFANFVLRYLKRLTSVDSTASSGLRRNKFANLKYNPDWVIDRSSFFAALRKFDQGLQAAIETNDQSDQRHRQTITKPPSPVSLIPTNRTTVEPKITATKASLRHRYSESASFAAFVRTSVYNNPRLSGEPDSRSNTSHNTFIPHTSTKTAFIINNQNIQRPTGGFPIKLIN